MSSSQLQPALSRDDLLEAMRKAKLDPPDLSPLFDHWPQGASPHYDEIRKDVEAYVQSVVPPGKEREKHIGADYAWLYACWFPYAPLEGLRIISRANVWLFLWDDQIDNDSGPMWANWGAAETFRRDTKQFVRACLGLSVGNPYHITDDIRINSGGRFLESIRDHYSLSQRKMYCEEIEKFIDSVAVEQKVRLEGRVPTLEEFRAVRLASSGVAPEMCYLPLAYDNAVLEFPAKVFEDSGFKACWNSCIENVAFVNDVWSLRKEINEGAIDSLVPLLYAQERDLDRAWKLAIDLIATTVKEFDKEAEALLIRFASEPEIISKLRDFIQGCRYICTGNLLWSFRTARFNGHTDP